MGKQLDVPASVYATSGRLASGNLGARVHLGPVSSRDGGDNGGSGTGRSGRLPGLAPSASGSGGVRGRGVGPLDGPEVVELIGRGGSHRMGEPGASSYTDTCDSRPGGRAELSGSEDTSERTLERRTISGDRVAMTGDEFLPLDRAWLQETGCSKIQCFTGAALGENSRWQAINTYIEDML